MSFETIRKAKLFKNMAYPTSAQILCEKLDTVEQKSEVTVTYSYYKPMTDRRYSTTSVGLAGKKRNPLPSVITAQYENSAVSLHTPNSWQKDESRINTYSKAKWTLDVQAVSVEELQTIRDGLEENGYRKLQEWFFATNKKAGSIGRFSMTIAFDGEKLVYEYSPGSK